MAVDVVVLAVVVDLARMQHPSLDVFCPTRQHPDSDDNTTAGTSLYLLFAHQEAQKSTWDVEEMHLQSSQQPIQEYINMSTMKSQRLPD